MIFKLAILILVGYAAAWDLDDCECGRINLPVCGSDGVSYDNQCILECAQAYLPSLTRAHEGACKAARDADTNCQVTLDLRPVCGTNGVTYPNESVLDCEAAKDPSVQLKHKGECAKA